MNSFISGWLRRRLATASIRQICPSNQASDHACLYPHMYRVLIACGLAATVALTWPLWQTRESPPMLPLLPIWQIDMGWPLVFACAALAISPTAGFALCWAMFAWAIASDQTRLQPQIPSMLLLSFSTMGSKGSELIARASLISLWFFAGVHKLLSPDYYTQLIPWLLGAEWQGTWGYAAGVVLAFSESLLAVLCLVPRSRTMAALLTFAIHAGVLALLSPAFLNWNSAVWPWNVVLAIAGPNVVLRWRGWGLGDSWSESPTWAKCWAVALLFMPAGYWLGVVDANLAACLYANNTPKAFVCTAFDRTSVNEFCETLNVPLPPAHRLYRPFFLGVGRAGTWLEVDDPRTIARLLGFRKTTVIWNDLVPDGAQIVVPEFGNDSTGDE